MMKNDYVVFTKAGLEELEIILESRQANYDRNKKLPRPPLPYDHLLKEKKPKRDIFKQIGKEVSEMVIPEKLHIVNPALRSYLKEMTHKKIEERKSVESTQEAAKEAVKESRS